jgi:hypothetical protein
MVEPFDVLLGRSGTYRPYAHSMIRSPDKSKTRLSVPLLTSSYLRPQSSSKTLNIPEQSTQPEECDRANRSTQEGPNHSKGKRRFT